MTRLFNLRNWSRAGLLGFLLLPGFAQAICRNDIKPSFTYAPVVTSGAQSSIEISAPAGCFWEIVNQPDWIKILSSSRGFGSGSLVFKVLDNKIGALSPGYIRLILRDLSKRQTAAVDLAIRAARPTEALRSDITGGGSQHEHIQRNH